MILDDIVAYKRDELTVQKRKVSLARLKDGALYLADPPGFLDALQTRAGRTIIAEVKKASPSKGVIRADFDPLDIARRYHAAGAAAVSVLTEKQFFQGSLEYLRRIRTTVPIPLLRKDFLFDEYQVHETRAFGASAILLIVAILDDSRLADLAQLASALGMDCLIEVHDERERDRALAAGATLLGINNRDLRTFHTTIETTERLVRDIPDDVFVVSESGLSSAAQLARLEAQGVGAFLIGETCIAAADPGAALRALLDPSG